MIAIKQELAEIYSQIVVEGLYSKPNFERYFALHRRTSIVTELDHEILRHFFLFQRSLGEHHDLRIDQSLPVVAEMIDEMNSPLARFKVLELSPLGLSQVILIRGQILYNYWDFCEEQLLFPDQWFRDVQDFSSGLGLIRDQGRYRFIKVTGEELLDGARFIYAESFTQGLAHVSVATGYSPEQEEYYIKPDGSEAFNGRRFFTANPFDNEGLAVVSDEEDKFYYIKLDGSEAFNGQRFIEAQAFFNGLALVSQEEDCCYYIKPDGSQAFNGQLFISASYFDGGYAEVEDEKGFFLIDTDGNEVFNGKRFGYISYSSYDTEPSAYGLNGDDKLYNIDLKQQTISLAS